MRMEQKDFEGTLVLERLAELGVIDEFWEAIDSDDFHQAKLLMKRAKIDSETLAIVLRKMSTAED